MAAAMMCEDEWRVSRYRIVGEDEAYPEHQLLSWLSSLARALDGAKVGDTNDFNEPLPTG